MATPRTTAGMTLIELLTVLAIVACLCAAAYPSYRRQLVRAGRTEAIEALLAAASAQERFYLDHGRYTDRFAADDPGGSPGLPVGPYSTRRRYRLSLAADPPSDFVVEALPVAGAGQDRDPQCARWSVRADGRRAAYDAMGRDATTRCW